MKRIIDIILSVTLIVLLLPLFLIIGIWIKADSPGPFLFKQKRVAKNNTHFEIYKFRSMRTDTPNVATDLLTDSRQYITPSGKFIRKTSIDELPQLFNILKGDMSFIGPRPALYNQYELIEKRTMKGVHTLRPGLTGYAQVRGRDNITDDEKVIFDEYYLNNQGPVLDTQIFFWTIYKVFKNDDVIH